MSKTKYLKRSVVKHFTLGDNSCPNCGNKSYSLADKKYLIFELRRCTECRLMYRTPTDPSTDGQRYYEEEYDVGVVSSIPSSEVIDSIKRHKFDDFEKDFTYYISVVQSFKLPENPKLFDFGCSWGYGAFQFVANGFDVMGYELATNRRQIAEEELGISQIYDIELEMSSGEYKNYFDIVFASHVVEHLPKPGFIRDVANYFLKTGGLLVTFTPNGSASARCKHQDWSKLWGEVHPNFIDEVFLNYLFQDWPRILTSSPAQEPISAPDQPVACQLGDLSGSELIFAAQKPFD